MFDGIIIPDIEDEIQVCKEHNICREDFHSIHMHLRGICADGMGEVFRKKDYIVFKELHLKVSSNEFNGEYFVPRKLPVIPKGYSQYIYIKNNIYYKGLPVFAHGPVTHVPLPEKDTPRYLKGYSFPFIGTKVPYHELRINPRSTGRCPGRCLFCHRGYSHRLQPSPSKGVISPEEIVEIITRNHNATVFDSVSHIAVITELFGQEDSFLEYISRLKDLLLKAGFPSNTKFGTCAQDVRSEKGLSRLYEIVNEKRYSYSLEVFSNRSKIMGKYKGIPIDVVEKILRRARKVGFNEIKLNYIAGIDPFNSFEEGLYRLRDKELIDSIGLNIFTAFFSDQFKLRNREAWGVEYYLKIIETVKNLGISFYKPNCFEMGYPLRLL